MEKGMKRLAMIAVTGVMAIALSACGGNDAPPVPDANTDDNMMQTQMPQPAEATIPAVPGTESEAVVATPAPADAAAPVDATAPTDAQDAQMTGETTQAQ
jgi:hypothetical protein